MMKPRQLLLLLFAVVAGTVLFRGWWDNGGKPLAEYGIPGDGAAAQEGEQPQDEYTQHDHHEAAEKFQNKLRQRQRPTAQQQDKQLPQVQFVVPDGLSQLEEAMLSADARSGGEDDLPEELKLSDAVYVDVDELPTCASLGLADQPNAADAKPARVFDTVLFNSEFTQAEVRFMTLANVVDYFVVVEANITHQGTPKPYYFDSMWERLDDALKAKIIRVKLEMTTDTGDATAGQWRYEQYMRRHGTIQMGAIAKGGAQAGDIVMVSDLDEIPRPSLVLSLKLDRCQVAYPITVEVALSYYSFRVLHNPTWLHPNIDRLGSSGSDYQCTGQDLRENGKPPCISKTVIHKGGWSCSWCFKTIGRYLNKVQSYPHVEHNTPQFNRPEHIARHIFQGADLFDRSFIHNTVLPPGQPVDAPSYLLDHPDRFDYLLDHLQKPFVQVYADSKKQ